MKKRILATICALACACTMSSPVYAKGLIDEPQPLDTSIMQTMSNNGTYNISVCSSTEKMQQTDITSITGTLNASNLTDTCTITVPERAALVLYSSATYPSKTVSIDLKSETGVSLATQSLFSSTTGISEDVDDGILVEPGTYTLTYTVNSAITDSVTYTTKIMAYRAATEENVDAGAGYVGFHKAGEDVYKKVTVKKGGLLEVGVAGYSGWGKAVLTGAESSSYTYGEGVTLCNSKKTPITTQETTSSASGYSNFYAVKAGTYYVRISPSYDDYYIFVTKFTAGGTTSNTSKAKAQKLSSKYKSTLMPIGGSSKARWYKVTLKKKKIIEVLYEFYGMDGAATVALYNRNGKRLTYDYSIYSGKIDGFTSQRKYPKGTYYIKLSKPSGSAYSMEGFLKLKVK